MFMPEGLKYFGGPSIAPPTTNAVKKTFVVDNMGCEACIDAVGRIINRANGVVSSNIELDTGEATVWIAKDWNFDPTTCICSIYHITLQGGVNQQNPNNRQRNDRQSAKVFEWDSVSRIHNANANQYNGNMLDQMASNRANS